MNLGLVKPSEIMDAIAHQNEQRLLGLKPDRIGQILVERGALTSDDVTRIMEGVEELSRTLDLPGFTSLELVDRDNTTLQFRGFTIGTRKTVLIRILRFGLAESPEDTKRFLDECSTLARLDHPNVVKVLSTGHLEGIPYLVLENVPGPTLRARIEEDGPMEEPEAVRLLTQVAEGLGHAHSVSVFHGSVQPDAILLPRVGPAKVTDFALFDWCSFAAAQGAARLDTPYYLSPEQARKTTRATAASDIYSLGATIYHVLTGRPPFSGPYLEVLRQHMKRTPPSPRVLSPSISKQTAGLIVRMLAKHPEDRPGSMEEVVRLTRRQGAKMSDTHEIKGVPDRLRSRRS
jgi:serine/threonine-protein kinase